MDINIDWNYNSDGDIDGRVINTDKLGISIFVNSIDSYNDKAESKVKNQLDKSTNLDASADGVTIQNLQQYRAVSPLFDLILPNSNVFGLTPSATQSVADGFWIILQPFPAGKHEVRFSSSSVDFTSSGVMNFATEAKYHLNVQ